MPNENNSNNPFANPETQPLSQRPVAPTTPQQNEMGEHPDSGTDDKNNKSIEIEKDIRSGERWLIGISAAGIIINVVIALIYYGQLGQMRKATQAAESAAKTADATLKEIRAGGTDTHELAVQAKNQADRTKEIADRALVQANASNELARQTKRSADAATTAANMATNTLAQANISWLHPDFKVEAIQIAVNAPIEEPFGVTNLGRGPAVGVKGKVNAELRRMEDAPLFDYNAGELFFYAGVLSPNTASTKMAIYVPDTRPFQQVRTKLLLSDEMVKGFNGGQLYIALYGRIAYRDLLFPKQNHWIQFCTVRGDQNMLSAKALEACLGYNRIDEEDSSITIK